MVILEKIEANKYLGIFTLILWKYNFFIKRRYDIINKQLKYVLIILIVISMTLSVSYAHPGHGNYIDEVTSEDVVDNSHSSSDSQDSSSGQSSSKSSSNSKTTLSHSSSKSNNPSSSDTSNSHSSNKDTSSKNTKNSQNSAEIASSQSDETLNNSINSNNTHVKSMNNTTNDTITEEVENANLLTPNNILLFIFVFIIGFGVVILFDKFKNRWSNIKFFYLIFFKNYQYYQVKVF